MAAAAGQSAPPTLLTLRYEYVADILERRAPYRQEHLELANTAVAKKKLLMAGAFTEAPLGGLFLWTPCATRADIEAFVAADPYVTNQLVTKHTIQ